MIRSFILQLLIYVQYPLQQQQQQEQERQMPRPSSVLIDGNQH